MVLLVLKTFSRENFAYLLIFAAPKTFGDWTNQGNCVAKGDFECGPGTQIQKRTCTDGTIDKCTDAEKQRSVSCDTAGAQLPPCIGSQILQK